MTEATVSGIETRLFIDGKWVESGSRFSVINPYDGTELAKVSSADSEIVGDAVRAAGKKSMQELTPAERAKILSDVSSEIMSHKESLASLIVAESGKPLRYAAGEVERAVQTFSFAAEEARRIHGETIELDAHTNGKGHFGFWHRFPLGVIAAISPFNFPLNLVAHKVAPALAAGNSVVLKPASTTPLVSLALARILEKCGVPAGGINVVPGKGSEVGDSLVMNPDVRMVTFTGSLEVGRAIRRSAGIKRVTLELGSNSALIVQDRSRVDEAVSRSVIGAFAFSGQVCISIQRIMLNSMLADEFLAAFLEGVKNIKRGNPAEQSTEIGPMISEQEACRAESWVNEAVGQGAKVLTGGKREGAFYYPTVLDNVNPEMKVYSEEVFAPVVCIERYDNFEDALNRVNNSRYGLQAGVYTDSISQAMEAFRQLHVGGVIINDFPTFRVDQMPYGGVKSSGDGREGPRFAIEEMTEIRLCAMKI